MKRSGKDVAAREGPESLLAASELRYRKLFEMAKDGILLIDPVTEKIIDANPFLLKLIGYTLDDLIGKKLWDIGVFEDTEAAKAMFQELQKAGYVRYEDLPVQSKDGTVHEVEFVSNRYSIGDGEMIQCNIRDITDRKAAERKASEYLGELERLIKMMTGRELKMIDLKAEIKALQRKSGAKAP